MYIANLTTINQITYSLLKLIMLHVYLPGNSQKNQEFTEALAKKAYKKGFSFYARRWPHWQDEQVEFDVARELDYLSKVIRPFRKNYGIVAKSIGAVVALDFLGVLPQQPNYLLLMGLPGESCHQNYTEIVEKLKNYLAQQNTHQLHIWQNDQDPVGDLQAVRTIYTELSDSIESADTLEHDDTHERFTQLHYREFAAADHRYEYKQEIVKFIKPYK